MKQICSLGYFECDDHTVHTLSQRRLTADWLDPRERDWSRMNSRVSSDWLPSYIKAMGPVLEMFTIAGYFPESPRKFSRLTFESYSPHVWYNTDIPFTDGFLCVVSLQGCYHNMVVGNICNIRLNKTPTWCNKMQILLLQTFSTCFVPNMAKWGSTCNHNYLYRWLPCQYFILLMMGAWRPNHVEKVCSNKICILLHHVGFLFNLILWCT